MFALRLIFSQDSVVENLAKQAFVGPKVSKVEASILGTVTHLLMLI